MAARKYTDTVRMDNSYTNHLSVHYVLSSGFTDAVLKYMELRPCVVTKNYCIEMMHNIGNNFSLVPAPPGELKPTIAPLIPTGGLSDAQKERFGRLMWDGVQ